MRSLGANAFAVYRALSRRESPGPAEAKLLDALREVARAHGGVLREEHLGELEDPLARKVAQTALQHRAAVDALPNADAHPEGWTLEADGTSTRADGSFSTGNPRDSAMALLSDYYRGDTRRPAGATPELQLGELDQRWLAAYFTFTLMAQGGKATPLSKLLPALTPDLLRFKAVEQEARLARETGRPTDAFESDLQQARERLVLAPHLAWASAPVVAEGARRIGGDAVQILDGLKDALQESVLDEPGDQAQLLDYLGSERLDGIRSVSAEAMRADAGQWPALHGMAARLKALGLMTSTTFRRSELFVRTHGFPSVAELVHVMSSEGGLAFASGSFKGVSTVPLAVASADRLMKVADPGFGDTAPDRDHGASLVAQIERTFRAARDAGRHPLVLGDGRETVKAMMSAVRQAPDLKAGYVELTQSGQNELRTQRAAGGLPVDVTSLAETHLKKLGESELLGAWLAEQLVEAAGHGELPDPREAAIAVVGYGDVGRGVALGLKGVGAQRLTGVDIAAGKLERARADGIETREKAPDDPLPPAAIYVATTGAANAISEAQLRAMPDGAHVINYASRGELDDLFLERAERGEVPGVRVTVERPNAVHEHETLTLELSEAGHAARKVHVHMRGQPWFDGRQDKDPMMVDLYMAGLLASLALQARRLDAEPFFTPELRTLDPRLQREVLTLLRRHYPQEKYRPMLEQIDQALRDAGA